MQIIAASKTSDTNAAAHSRSDPGTPRLSPVMRTCCGLCPGSCQLAWPNQDLTAAANNIAIGHNGPMLTEQAQTELRVNQQLAIQQAPTAGLLLQVTAILFGLPLLVLMLTVISLSTLGIEAAGSALLIICLTLAACIFMIIRKGGRLEQFFRRRLGS